MSVSGADEEDGQLGYSSGYAEQTIEEAGTDADSLSRIEQHWKTVSYL